MKKKNSAAVALGQIKSRKKARAARQNGLLGGRPKRVSAVPSAILRDSMRYRFLRSIQSRDHKSHTTRALEVEIQDWGKNLGNKTIPFWSSMPVTDKAMDRAVDAAMCQRQTIQVPLKGKVSTHK